MKAARIASPGKFEFVDIPEPEISDGKVKVRVQSTSVCGSDIHGAFHANRPEEEYPMHPGAPCHEVAGTVIESMTDEIKEGQRAIVVPQRDSVGNYIGGLTEYLVLTPDRVIPVPDWGSLDEWVMCQHTGTVLFSAKHWGNAAGKRIAVLGQGGIGLSFTMIAEKQGAQQVIGIDNLDYRLDKSLSLGATNTINPQKDDLLEAIQEVTNGQGIDVVVDATGDPEGFSTCLSIVNRWGTFISFSLTGQDGKIASFPHQEFMFKAAKIIPTQVAATSQPTLEIRETVALKERGWFDPGILKSHSMDFSDVQKAYDLYANREDGIIKVAMKMD
ncbi:MAG: zinc-binding dehydrogenase [Dehalococcoidia bacterium]